MSIQIENLGALKRKVRIVFPIEDIMSEKAYRLKQVAQNFTRPGFRRGKVPLNMIEKELGEQINSEAAMNKAGSVFFDICKEQKITVAGKPDFKEERLEDARYGFDIEFEVMPQVPVLSAEHFKDLAFNEYECNIDDAEVDNAIKLLQKMIGGTKEMPVDYIIGDDDIAKIICTEVQIDGEVADNFLPLNQTLEINTSHTDSPIAQLTTQLIGKTVGEYAMEYISTSDDPGLISVLNKTIKVALRVEKISSHVYAETNQEFFKKVNAKDLETLRKDMKKNLELQVKNNIKNLSNQQIITAIKSLEIDVPEVMAAEQAKSIRDEVMSEIKKEGYESYQKLMPRLFAAEATAVEQLKVMFFFSEFVKANKITVSPESIRAKVNEIASTYENPEEIKRLCLQDQKMIEGIQTNILEELAFEQIKAILPNKEKHVVTVSEVSKLMRHVALQEDKTTQEIMRKKISSQEGLDNLGDSLENAKTTESTEINEAAVKL